MFALIFQAPRIGVILTKTVNEVAKTIITGACNKILKGQISLDLLDLKTLS
ncbi:hypothetical protein NIES4071_14030 [Calothrix sp. NIES-4071]|nr:hypothetical protein NIES4071_14030 [Calothrix sp. NIES-4071]BAZ55741.1 hypothetical protein NIES4105_13980 [Calothrix sp. NIES-4105]